MRKAFKLEDLGCAHCAAKMQEAINKTGNIKCEINFFAQKIFIEADDNEFEAAVDTAQKIIRGIERDCRIVR